MFKWVGSRHWPPKPCLICRWPRQRRRRRTSKLCSVPPFPWRFQRLSGSAAGAAVILPDRSLRSYSGRGLGIAILCTGTWCFGEAIPVLEAKFMHSS